MLQLFREAGAQTGKHRSYKFWQSEYHLVILYSNEVMDEKVYYIHANAVKEGIVENPEDYLYSSARDYAGRRGLLDIQFAD